MEMERINENTIRVIIGKEDLLDRGITFLDLMGNQDEIEGFFYSILEEVDDEQGFQDTDVVTFQVLPNRDGIELYISKNINLDEDSFNEFNFPSDMKGTNYRDFVRKKILGMTDVKETTEDVVSLKNRFVFEFESFEDVITFGKNTKILYGKTNLYVLENKYYIELFYDHHEDSNYEKEIDFALFLEYGKESRKSPSSLEEYGKRLMSGDVLEEIKEYF